MVRLHVPQQVGQEVKLHFVYAGDVLSDAGGGLVYVGARGSWYPNRRPAMSDFDLEFRYPAGWTLIAIGKKQDTAPIAILDPDPTPNHMIITGKKMIFGVGPR